MKKLHGLPCGLPVLLVGEPLQALYRLSAMGRYVAKVSHASSNLYPEDPVKACLVDAVMEDLLELIGGPLERSLSLLAPQWQRLNGDFLPLLTICLPFLK